jgi:hypothetical protein
MTSNKKKSKTKKKASTKKKSSKKKSSKKKTGTKKAGTKKASSRKAATGRKAQPNPDMPPEELFEATPATATECMPGAEVAEPWHESETEAKSSLPDLMARNITENLEARSKAEPEPVILDTNATTAGSPTWRAFQASTRQQSSFVGRALATVWNMVVALLGGPPPAAKK